MNLIQHFDKEIQKNVYFWVREKDNVIMSPFWADQADAQAWLIAIGIEMGVLEEKEDDDSNNEDASE